MLFYRENIQKLELITKQDRYELRKEPGTVPRPDAAVGLGTQLSELPRRRADKKCIESKSLKLYLYSFRNTNTFHEESVNTILDAVVKTCSPRRAEVIGRFRPRGGIAINVKATYGDKIDE